MTAHRVPAAELALDPGRLDVPFGHTHLKEVYRGGNGRLLIHIQDPHANASGQKSLAEALERMIRQHGINEVLVEGSEGDVTLDALRSVASPADWKIASNRLLNDGLISGEEYLNLITTLPIKLLGVERQELYDDCLRAYAELADQREKVFPYLRKVRLAVEALKERLYPQSLRAYEKKVRSNNGSENDFKLKWDALKRLASEADVFDPQTFGELHALSQLEASEKDIRFDRASSERSSLLESLSGTLAREEIEELNQAPTALTDTAEALAKVQKLLEVAARAGKDPSANSELLKYRDYLQKFSQIRPDLLFDEASDLEDHAYRKLLSEERARKLKVIDRFLDLLQKAYEIRMSSNEFAEYALNEPAFKAGGWQAFVNDELLASGIEENLIPYAEALEQGAASLKAFYAKVDERDAAFVANARRIMEERGAKTAFLIAGGYHTSNLTRLLREEGTSYVVLTPQVAAETDQKAYEKILLLGLKERAHSEKLTHLAQGESAGDQRTTLRKAGLLTLEGARIAEREFPESLGARLPKTRFIAALWRLVGLSRSAKKPDQGDVGPDKNSAPLSADAGQGIRRMPAAASNFEAALEETVPETITEDDFLLQLSSTGKKETWPEALKYIDESYRAGALRNYILNPKDSLGKFMPLPIEVNRQTGQVDGLKLIGRGGAAGVYLDPRSNSGKVIKISNSESNNFSLAREFMRWIQVNEATSGALKRSQTTMRVIGIGFNKDGLAILEKADIPEAVDLDVWSAGNQEAMTRDDYDFAPLLRGLGQSARVLVDIHEAGWIHRDIKPANFLISEAGGKTSVGLTDFGIAGPVESGITERQYIAGTALYAPDGNVYAPYNARYDTHSFGVTLMRLFIPKREFEDLFVKRQNLVSKSTGKSVWVSVLNRPDSADEINGHLFEGLRASGLAEVIYGLIAGDLSLSRALDAIENDVVRRLRSGSEARPEPAQASRLASREAAKIMPLEEDSAEDFLDRATADARSIEEGREIVPRTGQDRLIRADEATTAFLAQSWRDRTDLEILDVGTGFPPVTSLSWRQSLQKRFASARIRMTGVDLFHPAALVRIPAATKIRFAHTKFSPEYPVKSAFLNPEGQIVAAQTTDGNYVFNNPLAGEKDRDRLFANLEGPVQKVRSGFFGRASAWLTRHAGGKISLSWSLLQRLPVISQPTRLFGRGDRFQMVQGDYADPGLRTPPADAIRIFNVDAKIDLKSLSSRLKEGGFLIVGYSPFFAVEDKPYEKFTVYQKLNGALVPVRQQVSFQHNPLWGILWVDREGEEWADASPSTALVSQSEINRVLTVETTRYLIQRTWGSLRDPDSLSSRSARLIDAILLQVRGWGLRSLASQIQSQKKENANEPFGALLAVHQILAMDHPIENPLHKNELKRMAGEAGQLLDHSVEGFAREAAELFGAFYPDLRISAENGYLVFDSPEAAQRQRPAQTQGSRLSTGSASRQFESVILAPAKAGRSSVRDRTASSRITSRIDQTQLEILVFDQGAQVPGLEISISDLFDKGIPRWSIGRNADNRIVLSDPGVSGRHAQIVAVPAVARDGSGRSIPGFHLLVQDLGSTNQTQVGDVVLNVERDSSGAERREPGLINAAFVTREALPLPINALAGYRKLLSENNLQMRRQADPANGGPAIGILGRSGPVSLMSVFEQAVERAETPPHSSREATMGYNMIPFEVLKEALFQQTGLSLSSSDEALYTERFGSVIEMSAAALAVDPEWLVPAYKSVQRRLEAARAELNGIAAAAEAHAQGDKVVSRNQMMDWVARIRAIEGAFGSADPELMLVRAFVEYSAFASPAAFDAAQKAVGQTDAVGALSIRAGEIKDKILKSVGAIDQDQAVRKEFGAIRDELNRRWVPVRARLESYQTRLRQYPDPGRIEIYRSLLNHRTAALTAIRVLEAALADSIPRTREQLRGFADQATRATRAAEDILGRVVVEGDLVYSPGSGTLREVVAIDAGSIRFNEISVSGDRKRRSFPPDQVPSVLGEIENGLLTGAGLTAPLRPGKSRYQVGPEIRVVLERWQESGKAPKAFAPLTRWDRALPDDVVGGVDIPVYLGEFFDGLLGLTAENNRESFVLTRNPDGWEARYPADSSTLALYRPLIRAIVQRHNEQMRPVWQKNLAQNLLVRLVVMHGRLEQSKAGLSPVRERQILAWMRSLGETRSPRQIMDLELDFNLSSELPSLDVMRRVEQEIAVMEADAGIAQSGYRGEITGSRLAERPSDANRFGVFERLTLAASPVSVTVRDNQIILRDESGDQKGQVLGTAPAGLGLRIGRKKDSLGSPKALIRHLMVSAEHARILIQKSANGADLPYLEDSGSANGVFVGAERVQKVLAGRIRIAGNPIRVTIRNNKVTVYREGDGSKKMVGEKSLEDGESLMIGRRHQPGAWLGSVSGDHARITRRGLDWFFEDVGSTNGSFVNGNRVTGEILLQSGYKKAEAAAPQALPEEPAAVSAQTDGEISLKRINSPEDALRYLEANKDGLANDFVLRQLIGTSFRDPKQKFEIREVSSAHVDALIDGMRGSYGASRFFFGWSAIARFLVLAATGQHPTARLTNPGDAFRIAEALSGILHDESNQYIGMLMESEQVDRAEDLWGLVQMRQAGLLPEAQGPGARLAEREPLRSAYPRKVFKPTFWQKNRDMIYSLMIAAALISTAFGGFWLFETIRHAVTADRSVPVTERIEKVTRETPPPAVPTTNEKIFDDYMEFVGKDRVRALSAEEWRAQRRDPAMYGFYDFENDEILIKANLKDGLSKIKALPALAHEATHKAVVDELKRKGKVTDRMPVEMVNQRAADAEFEGMFALLEEVEKADPSFAAELSKAVEDAYKLAKLLGGGGGKLYSAGEIAGEVDARLVEASVQPEAGLSPPKEDSGGTALTQTVGLTRALQERVGELSRKLQKDPQKYAGAWKVLEDLFGSEHPWVKAHNPSGSRLSAEPIIAIPEGHPLRRFGFESYDSQTAGQINRILAKFDADNKPVVSLNFVTEMGFVRDVQNKRNRTHIDRIRVEGLNDFALQTYLQNISQPALVYAVERHDPAANRSTLVVGPLYSPEYYESQQSVYSAAKNGDLSSVRPFELGAETFEFARSLAGQLVIRSRSDGREYLIHWIAPRYPELPRILRTSILEGAQILGRLVRTESDGQIGLYEMTDPYAYETERILKEGVGPVFRGLTVRRLVEVLEAAGQEGADLSRIDLKEPGADNAFVSGSYRWAAGADFPGRPDKAPFFAAAFVIFPQGSKQDQAKQYDRIMSSDEVADRFLLDGTTQDRWIEYRVSGDLVLANALLLQSGQEANRLYEAFRQGQTINTRAQALAVLRRTEADQRAIESQALDRAKDRLRTLLPEAAPSAGRLAGSEADAQPAFTGIASQFRSELTSASPDRYLLKRLKGELDLRDTANPYAIVAQRAGLSVEDLLVLDAFEAITAAEIVFRGIWVAAPQGGFKTRLKMDEALKRAAGAGWVDRPGANAFADFKITPEFAQRPRSEVLAALAHEAGHNALEAIGFAQRHSATGGYDTASLAVAELVAMLTEDAFVLNQGRRVDWDRLSAGTETEPLNAHRLARQVYNGYVREVGEIFSRETIAPGFLAENILQIIQNTPDINELLDRPSDSSGEADARIKILQTLLYRAAMNRTKEPLLTDEDAWAETTKEWIAAKDTLQKRLAGEEPTVQEGALSQSPWLANRIPGALGRAAEAAQKVSSTESKVMELIQDEVLRIGERDQIMAHGVEKNKSGLYGVLNIALEGRLRSGQAGWFVGLLAEGSSEWVAGPHGPYYVTFRQKGEPKSHEDITAYLVPSESEKQYLVSELSRTEQAQEAGKVMTYLEFIRSRTPDFGVSDEEWVEEFLFRKYELLRDSADSFEVAEAQRSLEALIAYNHETVNRLIQSAREGGQTQITIWSSDGIRYPVSVDLASDLTALGGRVRLRDGQRALVFSVSSTDLAELIDSVGSGSRLTEGADLRRSSDRAVEILTRIQGSRLGGRTWIDMTWASLIALAVMGSLTALDIAMNGMPKSDRRAVAKIAEPKREESAVKIAVDPAARAFAEAMSRPVGELQKSSTAEAIKKLADRIPAKKGFGKSLSELADDFLSRSNAPLTRYINLNVMNAMFLAERGVVLALEEGLFGEYVTAYTVEETRRYESNGAIVPVHYGGSIKGHHDTRLGFHLPVSGIAFVDRLSIQKESEKIYEALQGPSPADAGWKQNPGAAWKEYLGWDLALSRFPQSKELTTEWQHQRAVLIERQFGGQSPAQIARAIEEGVTANELTHAFNLAFGKTNANKGLDAPGGILSPGPNREETTSNLGQWSAEGPAYWSAAFFADAVLSDDDYSRQMVGSLDLALSGLADPVSAATGDERLRRQIGQLQAIERLSPDQIRQRAARAFEKLTGYAPWLPRRSSEGSRLSARTDASNAPVLALTKEDLDRIAGRLTSREPGQKFEARSVASDSGDAPGQKAVFRIFTSGEGILTVSLYATSSVPNGVLLGRLEDSELARLRTLFPDSADRKKFNRSLIEVAADILAQKGFDRLGVWILDDLEGRSRPFFEEMGFEQDQRPLRGGYLWKALTSDGDLPVSDAGGRLADAAEEAEVFLSESRIADRGTFFDGIRRMLERNDSDQLNADDIRLALAVILRSGLPRDARSAEIAETVGLSAHRILEVTDEDPYLLDGAEERFVNGMVGLIGAHRKAGQQIRFTPQDAVVAWGALRTKGILAEDALLTMAANAPEHLSDINLLLDAVTDDPLRPDSAWNLLPSLVRKNISPRALLISLGDRMRFGPEGLALTFYTPGNRAVVYRRGRDGAVSLTADAESRAALLKHKLFADLNHVLERSESGYNQGLRDLIGIAQNEGLNLNLTEFVARRKAEGDSRIVPAIAEAFDTVSSIVRKADLLSHLHADQDATERIARNESVNPHLRVQALFYMLQEISLAGRVNRPLDRGVVDTFLRRSDVMGPDSAAEPLDMFSGRTGIPLKLLLTAEAARAVRFAENLHGANLENALRRRVPFADASLTAAMGENATDDLRLTPAMIQNSTAMVRGVLAHEVGHILLKEDGFEPAGSAAYDTMDLAAHELFSDAMLKAYLQHLGLADSFGIREADSLHHEISGSENDPLEAHLVARGAIRDFENELKEAGQPAPDWGVLSAALLALMRRPEIREAFARSGPGQPFAVEQSGISSEAEREAAIRRGMLYDLLIHARMGLDPGQMRFEESYSDELREKWVLFKNKGAASADASRLSGQTPQSSALPAATAGRLAGVKNLLVFYGVLAFAALFSSSSAETDAIKTKSLGLSAVSRELGGLDPGKYPLGISSGEFAILRVDPTAVSRLSLAGVPVVSAVSSQAVSPSAIAPVVAPPSASVSVAGMAGEFDRSAVRQAARRASGELKGRAFAAEVVYIPAAVTGFENELDRLNAAFAAKAKAAGNQIIFTRGSSAQSSIERKIFVVDNKGFAAGAYDLPAGATVVAVDSPEDTRLFFNSTLVNLLGLALSELPLEAGAASAAQRFEERYALLQNALGIKIQIRDVPQLARYPGASAIQVIVRYSVPRGMNAAQAIEAAELALTSVSWSA